MKVKVDAFARTSPDTAFGAAVDIPNWPKFIAAIDGIEILTPGPVAAGTRFRERRKMFGQSAGEEMTVAEIDPPHRLLLTAFSHGTVYAAEHAFTAATAGTRISLTFEARPATLPSRIFAPLGWRRSSRSSASSPSTSRIWSAKRSAAAWSDCIVA